MATPSSLVSDLVRRFSIDDTAGLSTPPDPDPVPAEPVPPAAPSPKAQQQQRGGTAGDQHPRVARRRSRSLSGRHHHHHHHHHHSMTRSGSFGSSCPSSPPPSLGSPLAAATGIDHGNPAAGSSSDGSSSPGLGDPRDRAHPPSHYRPPSSSTRTGPEAHQRPHTPTRHPSSPHLHARPGFGAGSPLSGSPLSRRRKASVPGIESNDYAGALALAAAARTEALPADPHHRRSPSRHLLARRSSWPPSPRHPASLVAPAVQTRKRTLAELRARASHLPPDYRRAEEARSPPEAGPTPPYVQMDQIVALFKEFAPAQRNDTLRRLVAVCGTPERHVLSLLMAPQLHATCPPNCEDILSWLPEDLAFEILSHLDPVDLCHAQQVCRDWYLLSSTPLLWRRLANQGIYRMSEEAERRQLQTYAKQIDGRFQYDWKVILAERVRLRRNWLTGRCTVRTFTGHTSSISCIQLGLDKIASGSSDTTIKVWSTKTNAPWSALTLRGHLGSIRCLHLLNNQLISGSNDTTIMVWDLAYGPGWSSGSCRMTINAHSDSVRCLQADYDKVVSGSYDSTVKVWDLATGECKSVLRGHDGAVLAVQFDADCIVSGGIDQKIKVWNFGGECLQTLTGHRGGVTCLNFNRAEGRIFSGSLDGDLRFWEIATGKCCDTLDWIRSEGHTGVIRHLQADRWRVVTASDDKTVKVWDLHTGQRLVTLKNHSDGVTCVRFNDHVLVSGSFDETIKLLDFSAC